MPASAGPSVFIRCGHVRCQMVECVDDVLVRAVLDLHRVRREQTSECLCERA